MPSSEGRSVDVGEEDLRRDRCDRDLDPLVRGPVAERARVQPGRGPQDPAQVHRPRGRGRHRAGRPADGRAGLAPAGDRVVPAADRSPAAAGVLAEHRAAPRLHRRPAEGGGDGRDDPSAAARRARLGGERGQRAPLGAGHPARAGPSGPGHGAGRLPAARRAGADRLRPAGDVARPRERAAAGGVGVRDGPGLLATPVRGTRP